MSTGNNGSQAPTPSSRIPSHGKVRTVLKRCLEKNRFENVMQIMQLFRTGTLQPDKYCFQLLLEIFEKVDRQDLIQEFSERLWLLDPIEIVKTSSDDDDDDDDDEPKEEPQTETNHISNSLQNHDSSAKSEQKEEETLASMEVEPIPTEHVSEQNKKPVPMDIDATVEDDLSDHIRSPAFEEYQQEKDISSEQEILAEEEVEAPQHVAAEEVPDVQQQISTEELGEIVEQAPAEEVDEAEQEVFEEAPAETEQPIPAEEELIAEEEQEEEEEQDEQQRENQDDRNEQQPKKDIDALEDIVVNRPGIYQYLICDRPSVPWAFRLDHRTKSLCVDLDLNMRFLPGPLRELSSDIHVQAKSQFVHGENTGPGSEVRERAKSMAAKQCLEILHDLIDRLLPEAKFVFRSTVDDLLTNWKNARRTKQWKRCHNSAFNRAREIVLANHLGGLYGSKVILYGSASSGLSLPGSDIDVAVVLPYDHSVSPNNEDNDVHLFKQKCSRVLAFLGNCARTRGMEKVETLEARVPVMRYVDPKEHIDVDVTIAKNDPTEMARLFRRYLGADERVWELCMLVKYWAKTRDLCGAHGGFINSMGWAIMAIFYLHHACTPAIGKLFRFKKKRRGEIRQIVSVPWNVAMKEEMNETPIEKLLGGFWKFYGEDFDFEKMGISLSCQDLDEARALRKDNAAIFIEQPLQIGANVVGHVDLTRLKATREEMKQAVLKMKVVGVEDEVFKKYDKDRANNWMTEYM